MNVIVEKKKFDRYQRRLLREIIKAIRKDISECGVPTERIDELTENLAFTVSAIVDGTRVMQLDGKKLVPVLTFQHPSDSGALICNGSASFMHEYAIGMADELAEGNLLKSIPKSEWMTFGEFMKDGKKRPKKNAKSKKPAQRSKKA